MLSAPLTPVAALAVVAVLDLVRGARAWPVPVIGLLDEPAHLLTALIAVLAAATGLPRVLPWVLLGAVVVDLDHLALYLGVEGVTGVDGGRPVTHSAATVATLALVAAVPRWRRAALGLALGVALHLVRDLATGPGVPLLWPVDSSNVVVPYPAYVVVLVALAAVASGRRLSGRAAGGPGTG